MHIPQVFPKANQDYYGVIVLLKRTCRFTYFNQYVSSSTQRNQHYTRITNAFLLDQVIHFYVFKQLNILVYTEQYLYKWQDHFRNTTCKYTFSLEEE